MKFCGIDPGVDGAVGFITEDDIPTVVDLPSGPNGIDPVDLQNILRSWGATTVYLEDNRANGRNGSLANFSMGRSEGLITATVLLSHMSLHRVRPIDWRRKVGLGTTSPAELKEASRHRARELFPTLADELKRKRDHNRAEALLIAEAARRGL